MKDLSQNSANISWADCRVENVERVSLSPTVDYV